MGYHNVYYDPGHYGLTIVDEEDLGECYEFDLIVIWTHPERGVVWGTDAG